MRLDNLAMLRVLAGLLLCAAGLAAQASTIRLGTLVLKDSCWYELLVKMGDGRHKAPRSGSALNLCPWSWWPPRERRPPPTNHLMRTFAALLGSLKTRCPRW